MTLELKTFGIIYFSLLTDVEGASVDEAKALVDEAVKLITMAWTHEENSTKLRTFLFRILFNLFTK